MKVLILGSFLKKYMFDKKIKGLALMKALGFLKFYCENNESFQFANSPIISQILEDLILGFRSNEETVLEINTENLMPGRLLIAGIKGNLKKMKGWKTLTV